MLEENTWKVVFQLVNTINYSNEVVYAQVTKFLELLSPVELNKIPTKVIDYYKNNMNLEYKKRIDSSDIILENEFSKRTAIIIVAIFKKYLASDIETKKINELLRKNTFNDEKKSKQITNIFSKENENNLELKEEKSIAIIKETPINKIINSIKKYLHKILKIFK